MIIINSRENNAGREIGDTGRAQPRTPVDCPVTRRVRRGRRRDGPSCRTDFFFSLYRRRADVEIRIERSRRSNGQNRRTHITRSVSVMGRIQEACTDPLKRRWTDFIFDRRRCCTIIHVSPITVTVRYRYEYTVIHNSFLKTKTKKKNSLFIYTKNVYRFIKTNYFFFFLPR